MQTAYDEVPYSNLPFTQALPRGHATIAALHGLAPPDPRTARVLELGCGAGAHLLGVAAADPGVRAVGVDLATSAIETARADAAAPARAVSIALVARSTPTARTPGSAAATPSSWEIGRAHV